MLNVGVIVGSTRPTRFADKVAPWIVNIIKRRPDLRAELLDLRAFALPFINEPAAPADTAGVFSEASAQAWCARLAPLDAFIAITPEYNHGPSAVLKNAFDSALIEWRRKPIAFVGYGGVGGARAIEPLRNVASELQMAPIRSEVNIGAETFSAAAYGARELDEFAHLTKRCEKMLDDLSWWAYALKTARDRSERSRAHDR